MLRRFAWNRFSYYVRIAVAEFLIEIAREEYRREIQKNKG
jgi:hypothetical protein